MSERQYFVMTHATARANAIRAVQQAPEGFCVEVRGPKRSLDQSAKFHAICSDLARARVHWAGKPRTADQWKVLLVSAHAVSTKEGAELVPGLEGELVNLRESTATMSRARGSSLIEYSIAFVAMHGAEVSTSGSTK